MIYFVTAIGTDSGKTFVSSILTHALQADYWKPVQCGFPRDLESVKNLVNNNHSLFFKESYLFQHPLSPHAAAVKEGKEIELEKILLPETDNENLVIEGAGGILVPLNRKKFVIDIAKKFNAEIILVCNLYLGSINHSLLSIEELKRRNLKVKGIIFNGEENKESENFILNYSGFKCLLKIRPEKEVSQEVVTHYAIQLFENWE